MEIILDGIIKGLAVGLGIIATIVALVAGYLFGRLLVLLYGCIYFYGRRLVTKVYRYFKPVKPIQF